MSPAPNTRCKGFTLLELMVVLVLMGIVLSMMTISVGDGGKYRKLEEESQRLRTLINMAREEVIMRSQDWAIVFNEDGYQFELEEVEIIEGTPKLKKTPIQDPIFRAREIPDYNLSLVVEDSQINVTGEDEEGTVARVHILSSGEMTEFELTIRPVDGEDHFLLKATAMGELSLKSSRDSDI